MRRFLPLALFALAVPLSAQSRLHDRLTAIAADARGKVYVACDLPGIQLDCNLNADGHPPMQSTFKFPLAVAVFQQIEAGKLSLDQPVRFLASDLYKDSYSPLQDAHPGAGVDVPLQELIRLSVSLSDNIASDILLRLIGGPPAVTRSMRALGITGIHVVHSEAQLHDDESLQYQDFAEPAAMVALLRRLADHSPLTPAHTALLTQWMTETPSFPGRIKGLLPAGTIVTHKTGTSGLMNGFYPASNDVALITLPARNGRPAPRLALAIFVTDAHADDTMIDSVIARIAYAVYADAVYADASQGRE